MPQELGSLLKNIDRFGAFSQIQFFNDDEKFKTVYGGLLSMVVYFLGFVYFIYLMVIWQTQQIAPNVTNQSIFNPHLRHYRLNSALFDFNVEIDEISDKLRSLEQNGYLISTNIYSSGKNFNNKQLIPNDQSYACTDIKDEHDFFDPVCMNLNDQDQLDMYSNSLNRSQDTYVKFYVNRCITSQDITNNTNNSNNTTETNFTNNCLSQQDQSTFFSQGQFTWRLTLYSQDVDLQTGAIINIPQDFYFANLENQNASAYLFDLKITQATFIIDTGVFTSKIQTIEVVHSIELSVTQNTLVDQLTQQSSIASITYSLNREEEIIRVTYPKLGQILAELGSIFQILLFTGLIMNKFNDSIMNNKIEQALLEMYFPQIKLFNFRYNWRGKLLQIFFRKQKLKEEEFQSVKSFKENTIKQLRQKLNYLNNLHEISRIQIKLQSKESNMETNPLQQSLGYKMNIPENINCQISDQGQLLEYQDFVDVSYQQHEPIKKENDLSNQDDAIYAETNNNGITPPHVTINRKMKPKISFVYLQKKR